MAQSKYFSSASRDKKSVRTQRPAKRHNSGLNLLREEKEEKPEQICSNSQSLYFDKIRLNRNEAQSSLCQRQTDSQDTPNGEISYGSAVEVFYDDGVWYPGKVVKIEDLGKRIAVSFEDGYVETIERPCKDIRLLSNRSKSTPEAPHSDLENVAANKSGKINPLNSSLTDGFFLFVCNHKLCGKLRLLLSYEVDFLTLEERDPNHFQCNFLQDLDCDTPCDSCISDECQCPYPKQRFFEKVVKRVMQGSAKSKRLNKIKVHVERAIRGAGEGGGMYRAWRRTLTEKEQTASKDLSQVFPSFSIEERKELVLFAQIIKNRSSDNLRTETLTPRERRKRDRDVIHRESQKWHTARGRFQAICAKTKGNPNGFMNQQQWSLFLDACAPFQAQYFQIFTSKVGCCGSWKTDTLAPYRSITEAENDEKDTGCETKVHPCDASIDFLYATEIKRKQWTLDHQIEAHVCIATMKQWMREGKSFDFGFFAHLLFGLKYSEKYGAPNLRPRCSSCDSTYRRGLTVPENCFISLRSNKF